MGRKERRENIRVTFQTTVNLYFADGEYAHCETENLSLKGVFIPCIVDREPGEKCDVVLHLSGVTPDLEVRIKGEVIRKTDEGVGIQFNEIDIESFSHLKNIVYYNTEDPDRMVYSQVDSVPEGTFVDD